MFSIKCVSTSTRLKKVVFFVSLVCSGMMVDRNVCSLQTTALLVMSVFHVRFFPSSISQTCFYVGGNRCRSGQRGIVTMRICTTRIHQTSFNFPSFTSSPKAITFSPRRLLSKDTQSPPTEAPPNKLELVIVKGFPMRGATFQRQKLARSLSIKLYDNLKNKFPNSRSDHRNIDFPSHYCSDVEEEGAVLLLSSHP